MDITHNKIREVTRNVEIFGRYLCIVFIKLMQEIEAEDEN
jgi:hypothetical protein